jgi:hypothetical protein
MIGYAQRQKLTVPNSLALAAAAMLVWSANGTSAHVQRMQTHCSSNSTAVTVPFEETGLPEIRPIPEQCVNNNIQMQEDTQRGEILVKTVRTAGLRLLYLPAKALVNN